MSSGIKQRDLIPEKVLPQPLLPRQIPLHLSAISTHVSCQRGLPINQHAEGVARTTAENGRWASMRFPASLVIKEAASAAYLIRNCLHRTPKLICLRLKFWLKGSISSVDTLCYLRTRCDRYLFSQRKWSCVPVKGSVPKARYRTSAVAYKNFMLVAGGPCSKFSCHSG